MKKFALVLSLLLTAPAYAGQVQPVEVEPTGGWPSPSSRWDHAGNKGFKIEFLGGGTNGTEWGSADSLVVAPTINVPDTFCGTYPTVDDDYKWTIRATAYKVVWKDAGATTSPWTTGPSHGTSLDVRMRIRYKFEEYTEDGGCDIGGNDGSWSTDSTWTTRAGGTYTLSLSNSYEQETVDVEHTVTAFQDTDYPCACVDGGDYISRLKIEYQLQIKAPGGSWTAPDGWKAAGYSYFIFEEGSM